MFAGPQRFWFVDGRLGYLAIPGGQPHEEVHEVLLVEGKKWRGRKEERVEGRRGNRREKRSGGERRRGREEESLSQN